MANTSLTIPYKFAGETKAVANEVNANFEAIEIFSNGVNAELEDLNKALTELQRKPTREMFDVYFNFSGIAPIGAYPLWTGETITNCRTIYPDFWKKAISLKNSNAIRSGTADEYEEELNQYGETGMFVVDELNGHIRLPKILHFISSIADLSEKGCSYNDAQQRVYGNFWTMNWYENYANYADGDFKIADQYNASIRTGDGGRWLGKKVCLDSGTTCRNGDYVQPRHVKLCLYLQVANNTADISMMDINVIATELSNAIEQLQKLSQQYVSDLEVKEVEINSNIVATTNTFNETASEKIEEFSSLVSSISESQKVVEEAEENVINKAYEIKDSCSLAQSSAKQANDAKEEVIDCKNDILSLKNDVIVYAQRAEDYANGLHMQDIKNKISNNVIEIPQNIKLELNDGVLTLKAGSKVYVPNGKNADGSNKFDEVVIESDITKVAGYGQNNKMLVYVKENSLDVAAVSIVKSGITKPSETNNGFVWYDTANNIIKRYNSSNSTWESLFNSLPVAEVKSTDNVVTTINQVFNGLGYIGSTVFALPDIKGLIPAGRNEDGSLKNTEFVTEKVLVNTSDTHDPVVIVVNSGDINQPTFFQYGYNPITNYNEYEGEVAQDCIIGYRISDNNGKIVHASIKQPFRILDYSDKSWIASQSMPEGTYLELSKGASDTIYTVPANGYFVVYGSSNSNSYARIFIGTNGLADNKASYHASAPLHAAIPVKKGNKVHLSYTNCSIQFIRFYYAEGEI